MRAKILAVRRAIAKRIERYPEDGYAPARTADEVIGALRAASIRRG
jgi:hypothetical protein